MESNIMSSFVDSRFPVYIPHDEVLFFPESKFRDYIVESLSSVSSTKLKIPQVTYNLPERLANSTTEAEKAQSEALTAINVNEPSPPSKGLVEDLFTGGLGICEKLSGAPVPENMMRTENDDLAIKDTKSPIVDLFFELEDSISGSSLNTRLSAAWNEDACATLKIIFNARSIHLGKSSRTVFYRACGWLAENHPRTLIENLRWLVRPVIPKMVESAKTNRNEDDDDEAVLVDVDANGQVTDTTGRFDIDRGASHGYWKDILNLLVLSVNGKLTSTDDPRSILNVTNGSNPQDCGSGKERRDKLKASRHSRATSLLKDDPFYHALHVTVARLFAEQLRVDRAYLESGRRDDIKKISLAAKWAPSSKEFHDKHTFIVSSIAELLHPRVEICPDMAEDDREQYLKHAREAYRRLTVSPLRKALELVERDLSAKTYGQIKYDRVPSLAMNRYSKIFATRDFERFDAYLEQVATGKKNISGATLLPSTLISRVRKQAVRQPASTTITNKSTNAIVQRKMAEMEDKILDGQWNTLLKRIKESGTLESSIAVCDVSGSMVRPVFADGTTPIDSAIGLSLIIAEITEEPFGGHFITFSGHPSIQNVGGPSDHRTLFEKVKDMENASWDMNTDFVAVFEKLMLPIAVEKKLSPEQMVKTVFVFSDMHFDNASQNSWEGSSYARVKKAYAEAGYEMPRLVFWNLAGGRNGGVAPKPVDSDEIGTALVSGYSQAQLKVFLDSGEFEAEEEEVKDEDEEDEDEDGGLVRVTKKRKTDPLSLVKRAISHKAYAILEVVD